MTQRLSYRLKINKCCDSYQLMAATELKKLAIASFFRYKMVFYFCEAQKQSPVTTNSHTTIKETHSEFHTHKNIFWVV